MGYLCIIIIIHLNINETILTPDFVLDSPFSISSPLRIELDSSIVCN